ncbi:hypothetical protein ACHAQH_003055 [Verticillium albo-atrum]
MPIPETSAWKLPLSVSFWVLSALGSQASRKLTPDDSEGLFKLQAVIEEKPQFANLLRVARGLMTWDDYTLTGSLHNDDVNFLLKAVIDAADMVCATPSMATEEDVCKEWKANVARGIAIDEAANMTRADLDCVWGNALPCFLAGDNQQLPPGVVVGDKQDSEGHLVYRFASEGHFSTFENLMTSGLPVYRLKTQVRMARGLFDIIAKEIYPEIPLTYATSCDTILYKFAAGQDLEDARQKYPDLVPAPPGTFQPIFVHCERSSVYVDKITGPKYSKGQVKMALDFAVDLLKSRPSVTSSNLAFVTPYIGNVELIASIREAPEYSTWLSNTPPASTIDGFQGQEGNIVLVIMGVNRTSGPGSYAKCRVSMCS